MTAGTLRIGCGAGFWGDSAEGPSQLVRRGNIDVLMLDYLAEITMSLLARAREKRPELGYATDFVDAVMADIAPLVAEKCIKVVTNAGGVNPAGCRDALERLLGKLGLELKVAVVHGDDIAGLEDDLRRRDVRDLDTACPLPARIASANAYLGAFPIAEALRRGADIVLTGRCVDSALALGPLIAHFGWTPRDYDKLSMGSLAGHVIECGTQATGGVFTDWKAVAGGWADMGFPIAECGADGSFVVTKPERTGGLVSPATVAEQIVYEVHDPSAYILPDVVCDWSGVTLEPAGSDRVRVCGARGLPPTDSYKASLTYADGYRCIATMLIVGRDSAPRARAVGDAILERAGRLLGEKGYAGFRATSVEILGAESAYGAASRAAAAREVVLKVAAAHEKREALEIFAREIFPSATSMAQGITGFASGRPGVQPVVRLFSCLVPKASVKATVEIDGETIPVAETLSNEIWRPTERAPLQHPPLNGTGDTVPVPLAALAHGRSGDKGDTANIGILARRPEFVPAIAAALTPEAVARYFSHVAQGEVERYDWPGLDGFNFVMRRSLGGGGVSSLRYDPQGKGYAQALLDIEVPVPAAWLEPGGLLAGQLPAGA